jgi:hypothetical protein
VAPVAGAFLFYYALLTYCEFVRPEPLGLLMAFEAGQTTIATVVPESPASRAGAAAGDRLVTYRGLAVRSRLDLMTADTNLRAGEAVPIEVLREGRRLHLEIVPRLFGRRDLATPEGVALRAARTVQLAALLLAILVAWRRAFDTPALIGAWVLASVGVLSVVLPFGFADTWRRMPAALQALLWLPFVSSVIVAAVVFTFCAVFPRSPFRLGWVWLGVWAPMLILMGWFALYTSRMIYAPERAIGMTDWMGALVVASGGYLVAGLAILVANHHRLDDITERRRVRVLVVGWIIGALATGLVVGEYWLRSGPQLTQSFLASPVTLVGTLLALVFPLSFAYSILRHRLFDVAVLLRQGVRYTLARRLLVALVPALMALFAADLLLHRDQPFASTVRARGWIYAALGAVLFTAFRRRRRWLEALDRRFFRERYNAQQVLHRVAQELRRATDLEHASSDVVAQIEASLHPEFVTLAVRERDGPAYRIIATAPAGRAPAPIAPDTKIAALLRILAKPIEAGAGGGRWLASQLPPEETDLLRRERIELLVPVAMSPDRREALLLVGGKRSEEPYTSDDLELIAAIADSLALVVERPHGRVPRESFEECPSCGTCYDTGTTTCVTEGAILMTSPLPRVLAGRYRLDRRVGVGGMGTVYAAMDISLDRRVAAKVIREDLVGSTSAADRFRREARTTAGFNHPNVVMVHDFGITSDFRAFLVMELLTGMTVREGLARGAFEPRRVVGILGDVCAAVESAHRGHLVHRDLKPENIFLVQAGGGESAKVLDFGLAKAVRLERGTAPTGDTRAGVIVGTPQYMAPEQLRGDDAHPAWDLWALAVIAYEMLIGSHPFAGTMVTGWPGAGARDHLGAMRQQLGPRTAWTGFFTRALAIDPAARPPSAVAFLAELHEAVNG